MNLTTNYLGLKLKNPLMPGASPLVDNLDNIKRLEDAGASAIVLHSLFEEQLRADRAELNYSMTQGTESFPEALTYFPEPASFQLGPEEYLEHIRKAKTAVKIPMIASLNGSSVGGWTEYAKKIQEAGADALELNIYFIPTDPEMSGTVVEERTRDIVRAVKSVVTFPVAVKCSPFFSNMANIAHQLDAAGADALVLFNRFYQPDIDLRSGNPAECPLEHPPGGEASAHVDRDPVWEDPRILGRDGRRPQRDGRAQNAHGGSERHDGHLRPLQARHRAPGRHGARDPRLDGKARL